MAPFIAENLVSLNKVPNFEHNQPTLIQSPAEKPTVKFCQHVSPLTTNFSCGMLNSQLCKT